MSWYSIALLCFISCWAGMFMMALLSSSRCRDCKSKECCDMTLKCKKCGAHDLHITNRLTYLDNQKDFIVICHTCGTQYEIHNSLKRPNDKS